ncbi:MAG TPA: hypothetical protein DEQ14_02405 [Treponema sp.]|nr:hypothetical protein [Treponema sp.]
MKMSIFIPVFLTIGASVFGQQLPLQKIAPHRVNYFQEKTGKAIVLSENTTYWLYQSSPDDIEELIGYLHSYAENIGYVVDYDSFSGIYENSQLAKSVRGLMSWQKRNISVTIWHNALVINIDIDEKGSIADRKYYFMTWDMVRE